MYLPIKSALDWLAGFLLALMCAPLVCCLALLVKMTSPGPAFYSQKRVGKNGRVYKLYKLRTMVKDAEKGCGAMWSKPGDSRITPVGKWLRNTHLDELPQLLNILTGHMSLIGPRPERPEIIPELERRYPHYSLRLRVKPGVTGLAQMLLPADTDISGVRKKLAYDLYYVDRVSPMLDLRISLSTFMYFLAEVAEIWSKVAVKKHGVQVEQILDQLEQHKPAEIAQNMDVPTPSFAATEREPVAVRRPTFAGAVDEMNAALEVTAAGSPAAS